MAKKWTEKIKTLKRYDTTVASYDSQYTKEQRDKFEAALNHIKLNSKSTVLDAGCGTWLLAERIAKDVKFVVGVDFSRKMLERAKSRLKQFRNTAIICSDVDFLPFRNGEFTHIFAITLLQNMPNKIDTLNEITRVAKAGVPIIISGLKKNFTLSSFKMTLTESNLKQIVINSKENIKDYVAICRKLKAGDLC
jgi:ubiquinone/menaquinone biosynthesis C-methylase UbiE